MRVIYNHKGKSYNCRQDDGKKDFRHEGKNQFANTHAKAKLAYGFKVKVKVKLAHVEAQLRDANVSTQLEDTNASLHDYQQTNPCTHTTSNACTRLHARVRSCRSLFYGPVCVWQRVLGSNRSRDGRR